MTRESLQQWLDEMGIAVFTPLDSIPGPAEFNKSMGVWIEKEPMHPHYQLSGLCQLQFQTQSGCLHFPLCEPEHLDLISKHLREAADFVDECRSQYVIEEQASEAHV